jgi:Protein of unknown function (DUF3485)
MPIRLKVLPIAIATALLISSGVVHGLWTNRWHNSDALLQAVARVDQVPLNVGPWQGRALGAPDVDAAAFIKAGALGYWMRRYVNQKDGSQVTATLMCGPHGDIAVHPPEVCYTASGYDMAEKPVPFVVKSATSTGVPAEFRTAVFASSAAEPGTRRLRIFWAWNATGDWLAPEGDARWTFRGAPFLYKLYVAHEFTGPAGPPDSDPCAALLPLLLPQLREALFPSSKD